MLLMTLFSFWFLKPDFTSLAAPRTAQLFSGLMRDSFPPVLPEQGRPELIRLAAQTLSMSILAMAVAGPFGMLAAFFGTQHMWKRQILGPVEGQNVFILLLVRSLLLLARAVPVPIWALLFLFVLFPGVLPGALALGVNNWGIAGRLMAESVENMNKKPLQALYTLGASDGQVVLFGALPAAMPGFVSYILYRWENCLRETVIVGLVGAGGLGRLLSEQLSSFDYAGVTMTLLVLTILTFLADLFSVSMRSALR